MTRLTPDEPLLFDQQAAAMTPDELDQALNDLPGWELDTHSGTPQLRRCYRLPNFAAALALANRIGELAEAENHHPALTVEWGQLQVAWWSHSLGGVHRNDAIMAARTERLLQTDTKAT